jgi:undecaprenyl-diphosphatase
VRPLPLAVAVVLAVVLALRARRGGRLERVVLVALVAGSGLYGLGVIPKPDFEAILLDLGEALGAWTYLLVGGLAFLETGAFIGLVAPGETAVVAGGVFAGQGKVDVVKLLLLVWACCIAGDSASFWLGRKLGRGFILRRGGRLKITPERLEKVERYFDRRGGMTILVGRFIGLVRALAPFVAGASKMSYARFLPYDVVGCGLWASAFVLLGYFSWRNIDRAASIASQFGLAIGSIVFLGVGTWFARRRLRTPEQRAEARRWLRARMRRAGAE